MYLATFFSFPGGFSEFILTSSCVSSTTSIHKELTLDFLNLTQLCKRNLSIGIRLKSMVRSFRLKFSSRPSYLRPVLSHVPLQFLHEVEDSLSLEHRIS